MKYDELSIQEKNNLFRMLIKNGYKFKNIDELKEKYNLLHTYKRGGLLPRSTRKYIRKYSKKVKDNNVNLLKDKYDLVLGNGILPIKFIKDEDVNFWKNQLQEAKLNDEENIVRLINNYGLDRYFSDETKQLYQDLYGNVRYDPFVQQKIDQLDDNEKIALISAIKSGNTRNVHDLISNVLNKNDIPIYFSNEFLKSNDRKINEKLNYLLSSEEERKKKAIEVFNSLSEKDKMIYIHNGNAFYTEDGRYIRPSDVFVNEDGIYDRYDKYLENYKNKLNDIHLEGIDKERLPYYFDKENPYYNTKNGKENRMIYPYLNRSIQVDPLDVTINGEERSVSISPFKLVDKFNDEEINGNYLYNKESVERLNNIVDFANRIKGISPNYEDKFDFPLSPNEVQNVVKQYIDETASGVKYAFDYFNSDGFKQRNDILMKKYKPYREKYNQLIGNEGMIEDEFLKNNNLRFSVGYNNADNSLNFGIHPSLIDLDFRNTGAHESAHLNRLYNGRILNPTKQDMESSPYYGAIGNDPIDYRHIPDEVKNLLNPNVEVNAHDKEINENYSDLIGTRSNLQNEGIFNSMIPNQSFTKEMYDRYKNTETGKKDRFMNTHSEQQVIDALNLIAQNNKNSYNFDSINYAAEGGNLNVPNFIQKTKQILMDRNLPSEEELALRQSYAESRFNPTAKSHKGAVGLNQIMPSALQDYNKTNKTNYTMKDMENPELNNKVRMHMSHNAYNASWNNMPQSKTNKVLKEKVSHNFGKTNLVNKLNGLKKEGYDIYYDTAWLQRIPKESSDYAKFIVFGDSTGVSRNLNSFYEALKQNKELEKMIRKDVQLWNFKK